MHMCTCSRLHMLSLKQVRAWMPHIYMCYRRRFRKAFVPVDPLLQNICMHTFGRWWASLHASKLRKWSVHWAISVCIVFGKHKKMQGKHDQAMDILRSGFNLFPNKEGLDFARWEWMRSNKIGYLHWIWLELWTFMTTLDLLLCTELTPLWDQGRRKVWLDYCFNYCFNLRRICLPITHLEPTLIMLDQFRNIVCLSPNSSLRRGEASWTSDHLLHLTRIKLHTYSCLPVFDLLFNSLIGQRVSSCPLLAGLVTVRMLGIPSQSP